MPGTLDSGMFSALSLKTDLGFLLERLADGPSSQWTGHREGSLPGSADSLSRWHAVSSPDSDLGRTGARKTSVTVT